MASSSKLLTAFVLRIPLSLIYSFLMETMSDRVCVSTTNLITASVISLWNHFVPGGLRHYLLAISRDSKEVDEIAPRAEIVFL